jgi:hypothetical protein
LLLIVLLVGIGIFPILALVWLVENNGKAKRYMKFMGASFGVMYLSLVLIDTTAEDSEIATNNVKSVIKKVVEETPEQKAQREAKEKLEAEVRQKRKQKLKLKPQLK